MNTEEVKKVLAKAYRNIKNCRIDLQEASQEVYTANLSFQDKKEDLLLAGEIKGKNVEERTAMTNKLLAAEKKRVDEAEKKFQLMKMEYDLASYTLDEARVLLRILELTSKGD